MSMVAKLGCAKLRVKRKEKAKVTFTLTYSELLQVCPHVLYVDHCLFPSFDLIMCLFVLSVMSLWDCSVIKIGHARLRDEVMHLSGQCTFAP